MNRQNNFYLLDETPVTTLQSVVANPPFQPVEATVKAKLQGNYKN